MGFSSGRVACQMGPSDHQTPALNRLIEFKYVSYRAGVAMSRGRCRTLVPAPGSVHESSRAARSSRICVRVFVCVWLCVAGMDIVHEEMCSVC